MSDIIVTGSVPSDPDDDQQWALQKLAEFEYRKTFGLTHSEYLKQPIDDLQTFTLIESVKADKFNMDKRIKRNGS